MSSKKLKGEVVPTTIAPPEHMNAGPSEALATALAKIPPPVEKKQIVYSLLPLVSVLPTTTEVEQATEALKELDALQQLIDEYTARQDELKAELAGYQTLAKTDGLRFGDLCFVEREMSGRETLDKVKLMEVAGVTPAQLQECTKTGKSYRQRTFKNLTRKSRSEPVTE